MLELIPSIDLCGNFMWVARKFWGAQKPGFLGVLVINMCFDVLQKFDLLLPATKDLANEYSNQRFPKTLDRMASKSCL